VQANPLTQVVAPFLHRHPGLPAVTSGCRVPCTGLILLLGAGGIVLDLAAAGRRGPCCRWTISLALIVIPAATAEFD